MFLPELVCKSFLSLNTTPMLIQLHCSMSSYLTAILQVSSSMKEVHVWFWKLLSEPASMPVSGWDWIIFIFTKAVIYTATLEMHALMYTSPIVPHITFMPWSYKVWKYVPGEGFLHCAHLYNSGDIQGRVIRNIYHLELCWMHAWKDMYINKVSFVLTCTDYCHWSSGKITKFLLIILFIFLYSMNSPLEGQIKVHLSIRQVL